MIGRREFIAGLGSAAAWPLAARAQQGERMRRIGVLMNLAADDPEGVARIGAFLPGLQETTSPLFFPAYSPFGARPRPIHKASVFDLQFVVLTAASGQAIN